MGVVSYRDFPGLKVLGQLLLALPLKSQLVNSRLVRFTVLGPWFVTPTAKIATMTPSSVMGPPSP